MSDEAKTEVATAEAPKRTRKDYGVTDQEFVDAWQGSQTAKEVSEALTQISRNKGKISNEEVVPKNIVLARAAVYRAKGIKLKPMQKRNPRKLNVDALNQRIQKTEAPQPVSASA